MPQKNEVAHYLALAGLLSGINLFFSVFKVYGVFLEWISSAVSGITFLWILLIFLSPFIRREYVRELNIILSLNIALLQEYFIGFFPEYNHILFFIFPALVTMFLLISLVKIEDKRHCWYLFLVLLSIIVILLGLIKLKEMGYQYCEGYLSYKVFNETYLLLMCVFSFFMGLAHSYLYLWKLRLKYIWLLPQLFLGFSFLVANFQLYHAQFYACANGIYFTPVETFIVGSVPWLALRYQDGNYTHA